MDLNNIFNNEPKLCLGLQSGQGGSNFIVKSPGTTTNSLPMYHSFDSTNMALELKRYTML